MVRHPTSSSVSANNPGKSFRQLQPVMTTPADGQVTVA
jgi:hypothetical protein